jgi:hypothetical protein
VSPAAPRKSRASPRTSSVYDYLEIGESSLENALEADSIPAVEYHNLGSVKRYVSALDKTSKERVNKSKDFSYLLEDIAEVKKNRDDKMVSLNEAKRIAERDAQKARVEARKKERAARPPSKDKIWTVDLETAEKGKPLVIYTGKKTEEEKALTAKADPDPDNEGAEDENDLGNDAQLTESLAILRDYALALASSGLDKPKDSVALKKGEPATATP